MQYVIDSTDRIISLSDEWVTFATANGAPELRPESVLGQPIWRFIAGFEATQLWRVLFGRLRSGAVLRSTMRCDAPHARRLLNVSAMAGATGDIVIATNLVREEPRAPIAMPAPTADPSLALLTLCSWCNRVRVAPDRWVEVEDAIARQDLFGQSALPLISHGLCDDCHQRIMADVLSATG